MAADDEFEQILRERRVTTVFQPIVQLESGATVGYEALVRGPDGSRFASADALLTAAYRANRVVEFDWLTRASACQAALEANFGPQRLLFLNIEPIALDSDCPADLWPYIDEAFHSLRVVLEVTERSLDRDPGTLLDGVERYRQRVAGIALDDVGADPVTLAMLPLVGPAVIKLDLDVVQGKPTAQRMQVLDIVHEEAERTGAAILAEGVQTADHLAAARSYGAVLGQGRHLGEHVRDVQPAPVALPDVKPEATVPQLVDRPFDALSGRIIGRARMDLLRPLSRQVGACRADMPAPALFIARLPNGDLFTEEERGRLSELVGRGVLAAVLGPGVPVEPGDGIRGVGQRPDQPPLDEWAVVTLGPCSFGALLARPAPDSSTEWEYGITHSKPSVIAAARCLFRRLGAPQPRFQPEADLST